MPTQMVLDLSIDAEPSLENFVVGQNAFAHEAITGLAKAQGGARQVHLWGVEGSGRTHLLKAAAAAAGGRFVKAQDLRLEAIDDPDVDLWAVDDVDLAHEDGQSALFHLVNRTREAGMLRLVTSSGAAPAHLSLREDLRTRLAWGLAIELHALTDDEKSDALARHARARGIPLASEVSTYLLTHHARDMRSLVRAVEALDRYGLSQKRPLTLSLLRQWLQTDLPISP